MFLPLQDLVIAISKNILVGMEDMVSGLFNVMEVGNVTSQTNLSVTEDNLGMSHLINNDNIRNNVTRSICVCV